MAGYKRPYPAEWGRGHPGWDGPRNEDSSGAYYSGLQWGEPTRDYGYDYARAWRPPPYGAPGQRPGWNDPYNAPRPNDMYPQPYYTPRQDQQYGNDEPLCAPGTENDSPTQKQGYSNTVPNEQGYGREQPNRTPKPDSAVDFTDDYAVFYGNPSNNTGSGRGQGLWGQFRGQGRGQYNTGHNGSSEQPSNSGNQNQYYGNNETPGTYQEYSQSPSKKPYQAPNQGSSQRPHQDSNNSPYQGRGGQNKRGFPPRGRGNVQRGSRGNRGNTRGRGLPPSNFGGRGRGHGKASIVPPIHSLAKEKPSFPDVNKMSTAEKIHRFCLYLRGLDSTKMTVESPIQVVVNGLSITKLGLKLDYEAKEYSSSFNCHTYTARLKIDDVFTARCVGLNKKDLKCTVFKKAIDIMKTHTVAEIYGLEDPGAESLDEELMEKCRLKKPTLVSLNKGEEGTKTKLTLRPALESLVKEIKIMGPITDNAVCYMSRALAHLQALTDFEYCFTTVDHDSIMYFVGKFVFCGIVMGRGHGTNKKLCKRQVFQNMYDRLTTLPIDELEQSLPEDPVDTVHIDRNFYSTVPKVQVFEKYLSFTCTSFYEAETLQENNTAKTKLKLPIRDRLERLITILKDMTVPNNFVHVMDTAAINHQIHPTLVYKPVTLHGTDYSVICELYLEKIFIASGESPSKKECMSIAYNTALEILTSSSIDVILNEHRRITDEEMRSRHVMEVAVKGAGKSIETNVGGLKRFGYNIDKLDKEIKDLVILEHADWAKDRIKHSFCILQFSCSKNGLFQLCEIDTEGPGGIYKGTLSVQGKVMGESYGFGKNHARSLTATDALYRLYETQDVIRVNNIQEDGNWISYQDFKKEADSLRAENKDTDHEQRTDEKGFPLPDRYMCQVIDKKLEEYAKDCKELSSEFIISPGLPEPEWRYLRVRAKDFNMKNDLKQHQGKTYYMIYKEFDWRALADLLKKRDNRRSGRYELLGDDEKPTYSMVEETIHREPPAVEHKTKKKKKKSTQATVEIVMEEVSV